MNSRLGSGSMRKSSGGSRLVTMLRKLVTSSLRSPAVSVSASSSGARSVMTRAMCCRRPSPSRKLAVVLSMIVARASSTASDSTNSSTR